jgi:uncharacterized protein YkwD
MSRDIVFVFAMPIILILIGVVLYVAFPNTHTIPPDELYTFAQAKMDDLHTTHTWSHDSSNMTWYERAANYNTKGYLGEVLYMGSLCDVRIAFEMWEQSPTHKEVLDHSYQKGVLLIEKRDDICYIVFNVEDY